jgi:hypothetical protein
MSTIITTELREALAASAAAKGYSLSQEIEHRLRRSFDEDRSIIERLGGARNFAFLRLISSYMDAMRNPGSNASWLDDSHLYAQLERATAIVFDQLRPPGDAADTPSVRWSGTFQGEQKAARLLLDVRSAPPETLPIDHKYPVARIRDDLGDVADRIDIAPPVTRDEFLRARGEVGPPKENESEEERLRRVIRAAEAKKSKGTKS